MKAYIIWGIPPERSDETLIYSLPIVHEENAKAELKRLLGLFKNPHGCKALHVQTIDSDRLYE